MKRFTAYLFIALWGLLPTGCIDNDIPYPVEVLEITGLEGEGFTLSPEDIDPATRTVTLRLDERIDLRRVTITGAAFSHPQTQTSMPLVGTFDLRTPLYVTLSLYQQYDWKIVAEQSVSRSFTVEGQVGATEWDIENCIARVYVPEQGFDPTAVKVTSLKLGPEGCTDMTPSADELTSFESVRFVDIVYHGDIRERWYLYVIPTEVTVMLTAVDAWSGVIWLYGSGLSGADMGFRYRQAGEESWSEVPDVRIEGGTFRARLRALPETTYEVKAYCNGDETAPRSVTTEGVAQLPNTALEDWCLLKDIVYPYAADASPFWGSGNPGAAIAGGAVLTDKCSDVRPGSTGRYSALLESTYANVAGIGKFAAGNLYTGTYVRNAGTNGVITFGRAFTLRPTALKCWLKYECGTVDRILSLPAGADMQIGSPDNGVVYIALGTWTADEYGTTEERGETVRVGTDDSPICIDTRNKNSFFNPRGKDVVGYGELIMDYSVEEWREVTIPIEYVATDVRPTHILVVCSASRYGDYFSGSTKSRMWLDDFELIYE